MGSCSGTPGESSSAPALAQPFQAVTAILRKGCFSLPSIFPCHKFPFTDDPWGGNLFSQFSQYVGLRTKILCVDMEKRKVYPSFSKDFL